MRRPSQARSFANRTAEHTAAPTPLADCDGSSFGSGRVGSVPVWTRDGKERQMWFRGRNNFDAIIGWLQTEHGMADATEVILSGGSAGGLAVFYNLDHLATLLSPGVRLTGFPDAGFFLDAPRLSGDHKFAKAFKVTDALWNVTGSGGTNARCLAAMAAGEGSRWTTSASKQDWRCLMAPYIAPHVETPIYVMNSGFDVWQLREILGAECIPTPATRCTVAQNRSLREYYHQMVGNITGTVLAGAGASRNGVYLDSCYVHEQADDCAPAQPALGMFVLTHGDCSSC